MILGALLLSSALLAAALGWIVRIVAIRRAAVVPPRPDRWHRTPTPTFGGIAIAGACLAVAAAGLLLIDLDNAGTGAAVASAGGAMFVVGLLDDRLQLSPVAKLVASLVVGAFLVFGVGVLRGAELAWWQTIVAIVAFGGIVHALNLLDNMDGQAAGVGAIAALFLVWAFGGNLGSGVIVVLVSLAGALVGFLAWNVHPARLFMGDCGSLFIGAVLGGAALVPVLSPDGPSLTHALVGVLVLVVPLFDTTFVLVLRRLAGRGATRGGTDHVSHRLVSLGLTERRAVAVLIALAVTGGLLAVMLHRGGGRATASITGLFAVGVVLLGVFLARVPAYDGEDFMSLQKASFAPFLANLAFRWHALQVLLDVALITAVHYAAYQIRFEGEALENFFPSFTSSLPVVIGCKLVALYASGIYARMWATFGLRDLWTVVRGVGLGSLLSVLAVAYIYRFEAFSRAVFIIDAVLFLFAILATRVSFRVLGDLGTSGRATARRVLICGAGTGGHLLVREMLSNPEWGLHPVAFVDDDSAKLRRRILGVPVRGGLEDLEALMTRLAIDEVILSSQAIGEQAERTIRAVCDARRVPVRRLHFEIR